MIAGHRGCRRRHHLKHTHTHNNTQVPSDLDRSRGCGCAFLCPHPLVVCGPTHIDRSLPSRTLLFTSRPPIHATGICCSGAFVSAARRSTSGRHRLRTTRSSKATTTNNPASQLATMAETAAPKKVNTRARRTDRSMPCHAFSPCPPPQSQILGILTCFFLPPPPTPTLAPITTAAPLP